jgi:indolepyruvate ferredoxin oxidoreductase
MAYKDEYEVARLHTDPAFLAELDAQFPHGYSVKYNLAPPLLAKRDPVTGHLHQAAVRPVDVQGLPSAWPAGSAARRCARRVRQDRRASHGAQLIEDYIRELLDDICAGCTVSQPRSGAVALASVPDEIRGYGHVKDKSLAEAAAQLQAQRLQAFRNARPARLAA